MTSRMMRSIGAALIAVVAAFVIPAVTAAAALAAPTMLVNGRLVVLGSNGAVRFEPPNTSSTGSTVGIVLSAAAIILVVAVASLALERRSRRRLAAVPAQPTRDEWQTTGEPQEVAGSRSSEQDNERKAA
jgi:hypothetical protein